MLAFSIRHLNDLSRVPAKMEKGLCSPEEGEALWILGSPSIQLLSNRRVKVHRYREIFGITVSMDTLWSPEVH